MTVELPTKMHPQMGSQEGLQLQPYGLILRYIPILFILVGAGAVAFAFVTDLLGGLPGIGFKQVVLALSGGVILLSGTTLITSFTRQSISVWLLLGVTAIATIVASDLITIHYGVPLLLEKLVLLGSVAVGILLFSLATPGSIQQERLHGWRRVLAIRRDDVGQFMLIAVQLFLLVVVVGQYTLENDVFAKNIMWLTFYGFLIHFMLPLNYRLPFFVLLSVAAIAGVFGLIDGIWLITLGLSLIAICHLPVAFRVRVVLLVLAGIGLAMLRAEWASSWFQLPWSVAIWPILGSMFMFRLIVYMYDLGHQKEPVNYVRTLAYFFLLPNVVFPLFPVVDFTTFRRTYYNQDRYRIYQTGIDWMVRGAIHLILYRFVSYYLLIGPEDVTNTTQLLRYLVTNFLLYLRVSGQFHLIVGMLHLFGFNLPETHNLFYLPSSFTDFWRRINIYWKDFMLKVFYYPFYFRLRKLGATMGLVLATLLVFFATWFLHAYQWFWLRGSFLLAWQDGLFWAILAVLVVINSLYEVKRGRKRTLGTRTWTWTELSSVSLRTAFTFLCICVLWSLWTSTSVAEWLSLWTIVDFSWQGVASFAAVLLAVAIVAGTMYIRNTSGVSSEGSSTTRPVVYRSAAVTAVLLIAVYLLGTPAVHSLATGKTQETLRDLKVARLNAQDAELLERGYYEDLIGVNRFNSELWEIYSRNDKAPPNIWRTAVASVTGNFLKNELAPSTTIMFYDKVFTTNRWGMRDRDYEKQKPPGTFRIAVLGTSHAMGWGVADNETFEALLEDQFNLENDGLTYSKYENLNFSTAGYTALQNLMVLETKALDFSPDTVFYIAHPGEIDRLTDHLIETIQKQVHLPYRFVSDIVHEAAIDKHTSNTNSQRRLKPLEDDLLLWTYQQLVSICRQKGITPVWILLPKDNTVDPTETAHLVQLAKEAGFLTVNLIDLYQGIDIESRRSLWVAEVDYHPSAQGHQLIADRLYESLQTYSDTIVRGLWP